MPDWPPHVAQQLGQAAAMEAIRLQLASAIFTQLVAVEPFQADVDAVNIHGQRFTALAHASLLASHKFLEAARSWRPTQREG